MLTTKSGGLIADFLNKGFIFLSAQCLRLCAPMAFIHNTQQRLRAHFPLDSVRARFAKGVIWLLVGSFIRQGASFLLAIFVGRILGVTAFGKLALVQSTALMLTNVAQMGIGLTTTRYVASLRTTNLERTGRLIGFSLTFTYMSSLAACLIVFIFSPLLVEVLLKGSDLTMELRLGSGLIIFEMINIIQIRALVGLEAFRSSTFIHLFRTALLLPMMVFGAYHAQLIGTLIAIMTASAITCVISQSILRKECKRLGISINYRNTWRERGILRMSIYVWISSLLTTPATWFTGILLARQPSGLSELGLFNAADRLKNIVLFFPNMISQAALPILTSLYSIADRHRYTRALVSSGILAMGITGIGVTAFVAFPSQFMSLYGVEFAEGFYVLKLLALGCIACAAEGVGSAGLWAAEKSSQMFTLDLMKALILILLCLSGLAASAQGLALAHVISWVVMGIALFAVLLRFVNQRWPTDRLVHT